MTDRPDPMAELRRAKEAVRAELLRKRPPGRLSEDRAVALLDDYQTALKAAHAHKLAEQLLAHADPYCECGGCDSCTFRTAANLIRPKESPREQ